MIETIGSFVQRTYGDDMKGFSGWLVTPDGQVFTAQDLRSDEGKKEWGEFRDLLVVPPAQIFLADRVDESFNLDRAPDFIIIPATELGNETVDQARSVVALEQAGGEIQTRYMETLDHFFTAERWGRGPGTLLFLQNGVVNLGTEFNDHRKAEREAREALAALLLRIVEGESSPAVLAADLSIPDDLHEEENGGYYRHPDDEEDEEGSSDYPNIDGDDDEEDEGDSSF
jgi:hypothetical protein